MKTLVVYFSLSGTSRIVAEALAAELAADVEELPSPPFQGGFLGFLQACFDSIRDHLPVLDKSIYIPMHYDLVVIGGPIWTSRPATPLRAYLRREAGHLPVTAFFLTHGASPAAGAFREMAKLAGVTPRATIDIKAADVKNGAFKAAVSRFAAALRAPAGTQSNAA